MPDYSFYTDVYHGSAIPPERWQELCSRAADVVARYRRYYQVTPPEETALSMALCALGEALLEFEGSGDLAGAKVGSVAVTYAPPSFRERERRLYTLAGRYLDIHRGVCP